MDEGTIQLNEHCLSIIEDASTDSYTALLNKCRVEFVGFCLSAESILVPYLMHQQYSKSSKSLVDDLITVPNTLARKLMFLYAHLSLISFKLESLKIEPVPVFHLCRKMNDIGEQHDDVLIKHLQLIFDNKTDVASLTFDEFRALIATQYSEQGVAFHCKLREYFFTDIEAEQDIKCKPVLLYFMPEVFCQQHINSCSLSSLLSVARTVLPSYVDLLQFACQTENNSVSKDEEIGLIRSVAERYESGTATIGEYNAEMLRQQRLMEQSLAHTFDPSIVLHPKSCEGFARSVMFGLLRRPSIPRGLLISKERIQDFVSSMDELSVFAKSTLDKHFTELSADALTQVSSWGRFFQPEQNAYATALRTVFLFGKTRLYSSMIMTSHHSIVDMDSEGKIDVIEHKNGIPEHTSLDTAPV